MHDIYNVIALDHLDFAIGAGGFIIGWITSSLRRRWRLKPGRAEALIALDYYGLD